LENCLCNKSSDDFGVVVVVVAGVVAVFGGVVVLVVFGGVVVVDCGGVDDGVEYTLKLVVSERGDADATIDGF